MDLKYAEYLLEKTKENYNLIADDFSRTRSFIWEELRILDRYIKPGEKVLDLGCGNGRLIEVFQGENIEYFGVDNSEELIKIAKGKYPEHKFQVADALDLPFSDNSFDRIYSIAVLHHIPSTEFRLQFLKEAKRVLKPRGLFIATVWDLLQRKSSWGLLFKYTFLRLIGKSKLDLGDVFVPWKISKKKDTQRYFHCFTKRELKRIFYKAGFKVKQIKSLKRSAGHYNILLIAEK